MTTTNQQPNIRDEKRKTSKTNSAKYVFDLFDRKMGEEITLRSWDSYKQRNPSYSSQWSKFSRHEQSSYPSQGLITTPFDGYQTTKTVVLPKKVVEQTLILRHHFLSLWNHPLRAQEIFRITKQKYLAPQKIKSPVFEYAKRNGLALSINDLGAKVVRSNKPSLPREVLYALGPLVKLGRQARSVIVGSAQPDVWASAPAIATMAASHCLSAVPFNGTCVNIQRQTELAREIMRWLILIKEEILRSLPDSEKLYQLWQRNVMGTLEADPDKALKRARSLFNVGIRTFRVNGTEPGPGIEATVRALRKEYGHEIEVVAGVIIDVKQASEVEKAGADMILLGIGGGGRCITGKRSGSVVDWPELVWDLRGNISIPILVEGGANDNIAVSLLLGASGIGVSRAVAGGTIESPGGAHFFVDPKTQALFKPYGGEVSARTKYIENAMWPFNRPAFVEGHGGKAYKAEDRLPTLTANLHSLFEEVMFALEFRGAHSVPELQNITPSPIRILTTNGETIRNSH